MSALVSSWGLQGSMRHVLSALVQNQPVVLAHVSGMLASRGFNIDSLAVGETEDPHLARMTFVVKADGELDVIAKNALGERVYASPAFSNGDIFHRGEKHLWCIGKKP